VLRTLTGLEKDVQSQLANVIAENDNLRRDLDRLDAENKKLLGYEVDSLSGEELAQLIRSLTQAVERVRLTVQLRRLTRPERSTASPSPGQFGYLPERKERRDSGRMSVGDMKQALETLAMRKRSPTKAAEDASSGY
jgi:K-box region